MAMGSDAAYICQVATRSSSEKWTLRTYVPRAPQWSEFDKAFEDKPHNRPGFLSRMFRGGTFAFDPQFSTAKLDYEFAEHRNLSDLGSFVVEQRAKTIQDFARRAR